MIIKVAIPEDIQNKHICVVANGDVATFETNIICGIPLLGGFNRPHRHVKRGVLRSSLSVVVSILDMMGTKLPET